MTVRIFKPENRLAKLARQPGGKTVGECVRAAETRIEAIRERCVASLDGKAAQLARLSQAAQGDEDYAALGRIYSLANEIFSTAAAFNLRPLAEAAYSLCDMVEFFLVEGPVNWSALDVHVDGVRLLCGARGTDPAAVLDGLRRVRVRFLGAEAG